ncbi:hypothetical protein HG530_003027 [Fusarium avenaceum]|nr:hypothetical protein HG530_003027 [Fusarium avenaceum]
MLASPAAEADEPVCVASGPWLLNVALRCRSGKRSARSIHGRLKGTLLGDLEDLQPLRKLSLSFSLEEDCLTLGFDFEAKSSILGHGWLRVTKQDSDLIALENSQGSRCQPAEDTITAIIPPPDPGVSCWLSGEYSKEQPPLLFRNNGSTLLEPDGNGATSAKEWNR